MSFVFCDNTDQRRNSYNMENLSLLISDCTSPIMRSQLECEGGRRGLLSLTPSHKETLTFIIEINSNIMSRIFKIISFTV